MLKKYLPLIIIDLLVVVGIAVYVFIDTTSGASRLRHTYLGDGETVKARIAAISANSSAY